MLLTEVQQFQQNGLKKLLNDPNSGVIEIPGKLKGKNGYKVLAYLGKQANINGVWNVDTINGEYFVVHCGTELYEMRTDFSGYTVILSGLADRISKGIIINSKLLI